MEEDDRLLLRIVAKVLGINIAVMMGYSFLIYVMRDHLPIHDVFFVTTMLILVGFQSLVCIIASLVSRIKGKKHAAAAYFLSAFLVGFGGFCLCYAVYQQ